jgi:hypothetical protein
MINQTGGHWEPFNWERRADAGSLHRSRKDFGSPIDVPITNRETAIIELGSIAGPWGRQTLLVRDYMGETILASGESDLFLRRAHNVMLLISIAPEESAVGASATELYTRYLSLALKEPTTSQAQGRTVVVVLTKADLAVDLPVEVNRYVMGPGAMPRSRSELRHYSKRLFAMSDHLKMWLQGQAGWKTLFRLAQYHNMALVFSAVSAFQESEEGLLNGEPKRLLDPILLCLLKNDEGVYARFSRMISRLPNLRGRGITRT